MLNCVLVFGASILTIAAIAPAQEKYSLHESVHVGDKISGKVTIESSYKGTVIDSGQTSSRDSHYSQVFSTMETVLAAKDGSATEAKVEVSPDSYDTAQENGQVVTKTPCALAGQTVTLRRRADETITDDLKDTVDPIDRDNIKGAIVPDEDYFPDKPIAVGDSWDASAKIMQHADLGKDDKMMAQCRLDWVKEIDGKKMAQITCVSGTIRHDGDIESDIASTTTCLVDIAAGEITKADQVGTSHDFTAKDAARAVEINGDFKFHAEGKTESRGATTQP